MRGESVRASRIWPMRSTVSAWRQTAVSSSARLGGGGLRHASHSASASVYIASAVRPLTNVDHAVRAAAGSVSVYRTATPHHATAPGASCPSDLPNALTLSVPVQLGVGVRSPPAATVV